VKAWEEENKDKIKLFYLPAYSPDYNPDEYLNQDYKQSANKYELPTSPVLALSVRKTTAY
ncbi:transposase, partial [Aliarcobacter cibarius]